MNPPDHPSILLTKESDSPRYREWIRRHNPHVRVGDLSAFPDEVHDQLFSRAHGIIFTGGEDIHPGLYGKPEALPRCFPPDSVRDERELHWLRTAEESRMAILGICRGMQLINIARGGSLVVHLPEDHPSDVPHALPDRDAEHVVRIEQDSLLHGAVRGKIATVNSWHHQAIDRIAKGLRVIARAEDGVVEAVEGIDPKKFLLGVQWHPERMRQRSLPTHIAQSFLAEVHAVRDRAYHTMSLSLFQS